MNSMYFYYNGRKSEDLGVYLVSVDSGMKTHPYLANREIVSEQIWGNPIPYVYGTRYSPLKLNLTLSTLDELWTFEKRREVARWLDTQSFEEFYIADNDAQRYFLMYQGGIDLTHNTMEQGYINIEMLNISPFSYSPVYTTVFKITSSPTVIELTNLGDNLLQPEMWIYKTSAGDVSIVNLSDGGKEFKFTSLLDKETVYIDNQNRHIESDIPLTNRYDSFNGNYLSLPIGMNRLQITGNCEIKLSYRFEFKG